MEIGGDDLEGVGLERIGPEEAAAKRGVARWRRSPNPTPVTHSKCLKPFLAVIIYFVGK